MGYFNFKCFFLFTYTWFYIYRFQDKLQINFIESQVRHIPLVGYGQGTTIVSEPKLTSFFDLGPNFRYVKSFIDCLISVILTSEK
jgi:hypothetical protein